MRHLVSMEDLSLEEVHALIESAKAFKQGKKIQTKREIYASNLFFEASTRTHRSFEMAEKKCGLGVIDFDVSTSSVNKGETLYDTVLTLNAIGVDIFVIRHFEEDYYKALINPSDINASIINGGDGRGQHPTQCLLDMMTIAEHFDSFKGLKIMIAGDLKNSRVAHSNAIMLSKLGADLYFSGPKEWYEENYDQYGQYVEIDSMIDQIDVCMLLRVQHERHISGARFSKEAYHAEYGLTKERYDLLKENAIVMHPAPVNRDVELADECVEAKKSVIVEQMRNGVFMRMAILENILESRGELI